MVTETTFFATPILGCSVKVTGVVSPLFPGPSFSGSTSLPLVELSVTVVPNGVVPDPTAKLL